MHLDEFLNTISSMIEEGNIMKCTIPLFSFFDYEGAQCNLLKIAANDLENSKLEGNCAKSSPSSRKRKEAALKDKKRKFLEKQIGLMENLRSMLIQSKSQLTNPTTDYRKRVGSIFIGFSDDINLDSGYSFDFSLSKHEQRPEH